MKKFGVLIVWFIGIIPCWPNSLLIPMDGVQKNHLKAYGIAYYMLKLNNSIDWLLNYRGGSFLADYSSQLEQECILRGVSYEVISPAKVNSILNEISSPAVNMNVVRLEKAPRIAVYSPKSEFVPDETDAVILVLQYAEIPFDIIYDEEIHNDALARYDWLHLHHEDFTGQPNKMRWRESAVMELKLNELTAAKLGYSSISQLKMTIARKIKAFSAGGGYLFAMCSAAETLDIALAAEGFDFSNLLLSGDAEYSNQEFLDYSKSLAFENFSLESLHERRFSDINIGRMGWGVSGDFFTLFTFSAKWDLIPSLLTQNHENLIKEFSGLTTSFNSSLVKPEAVILGENRKENNVRYLYGEVGRGHWTYYSGHDPEGSPGRGRGPTDLNLHPNSPGYRLILNNVLFPSAQRKKQKT
ncbi:MAG: asparagine synthetase B [Cyclobacteriaceae bacterium]|jgi:hypothetical protein|nr:asparagine synthetase B [Cyclobacteriaceae bacterium]